MAMQTKERAGSAVQTPPSGYSTFFVNDDGVPCVKDSTGAVTEFEAPNDAAVITYTPAVLADWDGGLDPGNVDEALDQLAERVANGFTGGTLSSALNEAPIATLASASTTNIGAQTANTISITGTTTITAFDSIASGAMRLLVFSGILTLTHNGTSLILPTGANITTAAGDVAEFVSLGSGNWRCVRYLKADGTALVGGSSSAGTKTYAVFTPMTSQPPATNYATLDTRNSIAVLDFDASTDESAVWVGVLPEAASLGSGLKVSITWTATTATSGTCRWGVQLENMTTDIDSDSFDTAATAGGTANGTSGIPTKTTITITTIDSLTAQSPYRLKVYRDADGTSGTDDMTGDAELIAVELWSAA